MCKHCRCDNAAREPLRDIKFLNGTYIKSYLGYLGYGQEMLITEYGKNMEHHKIATPASYCPICGRPLKRSRKQK